MKSDRNFIRPHLLPKMKKGGKGLKNTFYVQGGGLSPMYINDTTNFNGLTTAVDHMQAEFLPA